MLKKLFIGLLVMSVISSGLLFFLLKRSSFDARSISLFKHDEASSPEHSAPSEGEHAAEHAEAPESHASEETTAAEKTTAESAETGHAEAQAAPESAAAPHDSEVSPEHGKTSGAEKVAAETHEEKAAESDSSQSLRLLTDPIGASVFVEGEFLGNTPVDLPLRDKAIKLSIESPGYKRFERSIPAQKKTEGAGRSLFAAVMKIHLEPEKASKSSRRAAAAAKEERLGDLPEEKAAAAVTEEKTDEQAGLSSSHETPHRAAGKRLHRASAMADKNFYIQVKSLPDQGSATADEVQRLSQVVRDKSAFAVHPCRVSLGNRGNWVRLLLGPFDTAKEAAAQMTEASALGIDTEAPFVTGDQKCL